MPAPLLGLRVLFAGIVALRWRGQLIKLKPIWVRLEKCYCCHHFTLLDLGWKIGQGPLGVLLGRHLLCDLRCLPCSYQLGLLHNAFHVIGLEIEGRFLQEIPELVFVLSQAREDLDCLDLIVTKNVYVAELTSCALSRARSRGSSKLFPVVNAAILEEDGKELEVRERASVQVRPLSHYTTSKRAR